MLTAPVLATVKAQYERTIEMLGVQATWASPGQPGVSIVIGSRIASDKDIAIVNAYGIGALIFTLKAADFPSSVPKKFDTLTIGTETHVIDHVAPVHMNGSTFGYRCFARGK